MFYKVKWVNLKGQTLIFFSLWRNWTELYHSAKLKIVITLFEAEKRKKFELPPKWVMQAVGKGFEAQLLGLYLRIIPIWYKFSVLYRMDSSSVKSVACYNVWILIESKYIQRVNE